MLAHTNISASRARLLKPSHGGKGILRARSTQWVLTHKSKSIVDRAGGYSGMTGRGVLAGERRATAGPELYGPG